MSAEVKKIPSQEEVEGSKIELRTSSGAVICLNFSEKDQALPRIVRLFDPDTDQALVFRLEDGSYRELDTESAANVQELQHVNHCHHCGCCDGYEDSYNTEVRRGDERLEKQKEKLQKKLRERKASNRQEDENCKGHCHQIIQLPIQGLSTSINDKKEKKLDFSKEDAQQNSQEAREKKMNEDLQIQKAPEVEAVNCSTAKISWARQVSNNSHLTGCTFDLQMFSKSLPYETIYSGSDKEFTVKDLKPGTQYKFRACKCHAMLGKCKNLTQGLTNMELSKKWIFKLLLAVKGTCKGDFSPEVTCHMPSSSPATPAQPHLANKTKTSFTLKWMAPADNGSPITTYKLEWNKGQKGGPFEEVYCGAQRQFKLSHKLPPATACSFRLQAVNSIGASKFSKELKCFSSAGVPSAPISPSLDRAGVNFLELVWTKPDTNGAEITEYLLEMEDEKTGYGFLVAYRGPEQACKIEKLQRNTCYKFRLLALNSQGKSKWSETVMFDTIPEKPGQPSIPVLQGKARTSTFTVSWDPPSDTGGATITDHILQADDGKGGPFTEVYRGLDCEYTLSALSPGYVYKLRLASVSEGGTSEWSKISRIRTLPVIPGQSKPPALSKTHKPQPNSLDLYWDPPDYDGGAEISGYILEMEKPATKAFVEIHHLLDNVCTVVGLLPGRSYSFRVKAKNEAGVGKVSTVSQIATAPGAPDILRAPDTLCRSASAMIVTWECPAENGTPVTGYALEWMEDGTFTELYCGPDRTFEVRKGISPASYYYFRVKALSAAGSSPWSPVSTCQTPAASPSAVTSVKVVQQSSSHVRLRWKHPSSNGAPITSYNVEVAGCKNISFDVMSGEGCENEEESSVVQEYDVTELQPNTLYRIRVQAVNKIGCGPFSWTVLASTGNLPPTAPPLELASASYQSLKLRWVSRGTGVTYTVQMMDKSGGFMTVFNGSTTSHKVGKLQERTEYQFRIQASNDAGPGPYSDLVSFTTTAQPPSIVKGLRAENITASCLRVSWEPVSTVRKGESIEYILQSQCVGKDQDFVQVYQGPGTSFELDSLAAASEFRFRVCAVRLMIPPYEFPGPLKGIFSSVTSSKNMSPQKKNSESGSAVDVNKPDELKPRKVTLTDTQWAMIFFGGFSLLAVVVALLLPCLFGVSD